jgi:CHAT domain-containing protein/tetratricopeptide (TPR) repeat protein
MAQEGMRHGKGGGRRRRARLAALFEFLEARTPADIRQSLIRHPELLDDETDALIGGLLLQAQDAGQTEIAEGLEERRALLARERARVRGGEKEGELPARVLEMITEIGELTGPGDLDRRIDLLRRVLADPAVSPHARLRAALSGMLGASLADRCDRLGSRDYAEAITALKVAFDAPPGASAVGSRRKVARNLGRIYSHHGVGSRRDNVEAAIRYLTEALQPGDDQLPPPVRAEVRVELAEAYLKRVAGTRAGNVREAIKHLEAAGQFFTSQAYPDEWAAIQGSLGVAYIDHADGDRAQNVEMAMGYLTTAHRHFASRGPAPACAAAAHNLGNACLERLAGKPADNVEMAIGLFEEALSVRTEQEYPLDRAGTAQSLGNAYLRRGYGERANNTEQAIVFYVAARDAFARLEAGREEAMTRLSLAEAYFRRVLGDPEDNVEQAITNLEAAEDLFRAAGMIEERAATLTGLGVAVSGRTTGEPGAAADLAISYHEAALHVLGERDASPGLWAMIQNNLGTAYLERGGPGRQEDLSSAITCLADALAGGTGRSPLAQAMTRHNLGAAYAERARDGHDDDLREAISHLEAALEVFASAGLPTYQRGTGQALGDAYARLGDHWSEAFAAYESALAAADALYITSVSRSARQAELAEAPALRLDAAYAAAKAGQLELAAVIAERGRARSLGDALARDQAELGKIRQQSPDLADDFVAAAARLRELEAAEWLAPTIVPVPGAGVAAGHAIGSGGLRQRLGEARRLLADAVGRIRQLDGHQGFLAQPEFADLAAVVRAAGPLAYLAACAEGSLTLLITPTGDTSPADGLLAATVEAMPEPGEPLTAAALRTLVIGGNSADGYLPAQMEMTASTRRFQRALAELLPVLGERLTGPLADQLAHSRADRVTLIACGLLGLLPLHAASYQRGQEIRCLLSDYAVAYAPSAKVLGTARSALATQQKRNLVLAGVASPAGTGRLKFAEAELRQIATWFPPSGSRVFTGIEATRPNLLAAAAGGATHIHFACHGIFNPVAPADSALLLSHDGQAAPLTLREITAHRAFADARLVVASACQTAVTDFAAVPDEAIGLPAGFLSAGTPGIVGTLWPVSDVSTALLMCRFYEFHLGRVADQPVPISPALALREAQLWLAQLTTEQLESYIAEHEELRKRAFRLPAGRPAVDSSVATASPPERPFAHPYHWASALFVGA